MRNGYHHNSQIHSTIKILTISLGWTLFHSMLSSQNTFSYIFKSTGFFWSFLWLFFDCVNRRIVNSSKLTHSLWLISLCLSWILLPVFEALQWADDCLGQNYYTNLSTLHCQALSPGRLCVFLGFIIVSLHRRYCLCRPCMSMHLCTYVYMCLRYMHVYEFHYSNLLLPWQPPLPSGCHCVWPSANIHHWYSTTCW